VPTVTGLKATRRGHVALHVDDAFVAAVTDAFVVRHGLFVGRELDAAQLSALRAAAGAERTLADAHRLLAHRARSRAELAQRLRAKGHGQAVVADVVERLTTQGLLDDRAFATAFVADKRRLGGWGAGRIARELGRLGVADTLVQGALDGADDQADELTRALQVLARRGPARAPLDADRKRAYDHLLRRGYDAAVAYRAVREWSASGTGGGATTD
jgi:regulatory protein